MYLATPALRRRFWVAPATALALALPWWVFSSYHFGSAIPTTLVIKTLQKSFGDATFANGLAKMWQAGTTLPLSLALVPAAVGLLTVLCMLAIGLRGRLPGEHWPLAALGLGGLADYGAYCLLGVPPYHWYYVSSTVALGVTGCSAWRLRSNGRCRPGCLPCGTPLRSPRQWCHRRRGRVLPRPRVPWVHPVIFGNWAIPEQ